MSTDSSLKDQLSNTPIFTFYGKFLPHTHIQLKHKQTCVIPPGYTKLNFEKYGLFALLKITLPQAKITNKFEFFLSHLTNYKPSTSTKIPTCTILSRFFDFLGQNTTTQTSLMASLHNCMKNRCKNSKLVYEL